MPVTPRHPLDALLENLDRDIDVLFEPLRRTIDEALKEQKPNVPRLKRRVTGRLGTLFGFSEEEVEAAPLGLYTRAAMTASRTLGAGGAARPAADVERTAYAYLWRYGNNLRDLLHALIDDLTRQGVGAKEGGEWLRDFLTTEGAERRKGLGATKGLYEVRRMLYNESANQYREGLQVRALRQGRLMRWLLDPAHVERDECDEKARGNLGFGPGVYPPNLLPPYPSHPHCKCRLVLV